MEGFLLLWNLRFLKNHSDLLTPISPQLLQHYEEFPRQATISGLMQKWHQYVMAHGRHAVHFCVEDCTKVFYSPLRCALVQNRYKNILLFRICYFLCLSKESNQRKDTEIEHSWWLSARLPPISALLSIILRFCWNRIARHHHLPTSAAISVPPPHRTRFGQHGRSLQHNCFIHLPNLNWIQCFLARYQIILDSSDFVDTIQGDRHSTVAL